MILILGKLAQHVLRGLWDRSVVFFIGFDDNLHKEVVSRVSWGLKVLSYMKKLIQWLKFHTCILILHVIWRSQRCSQYRRSTTTNVFDTWSTRDLKLFFIMISGRIFASPLIFGVQFVIWGACRKTAKILTEFSRINSTVPQNQKDPTPIF